MFSLPRYIIHFLRSVAVHSSQLNYETRLRLNSAQNSIEMSLLPEKNGNLNTLCLVCVENKQLSFTTSAITD